MADRDWIKNQSAGRITTTNTAYQDALTATGTPTNGSKDFWVLCSASIDHTAATQDVKAKLIDSTGAADLCVWNLEPKDTTDVMAVMGLAKWTSPVSPVSQSFKLQYAVETSGTAGIAEMSLNAIESHSSDQYIGTDAETTTTSTSYVDAQTLTFTPSTQGDYLIVAYGEAVQSGDNTAVRLDVDGAASHTAEAVEASDTTSYTPWMAVKKVNLTAASHTIKIQFKSIVGLSTGIRRRRILAIRLDTLTANSADYTATRATTTSTTAVDAASTTFTAAGSVNYLAIGNVMLDGNSTSISINAQISMDGAVVSLHTRESSSASRERPYGAFNYNAFSAGSRTVKTQVFSETASVTTGYSERGIYVLDLRAAVTGSTLTADQGSYTLTGQALALKASRQLLTSVGTFTLTGQAMTPSYGRKAVLDYGSHALTGQDLALRAARQIAADYGAFAMTGQSVILKAARVLALDYGSSALTGQDITFSRGHSMAVDYGSFALTGQDVVLRAARTLALVYGGYTLAGQALALQAARTLLIGQGSFALTGQDVVLTYTPGADATLDVGVGSFALSGQAVALKASRQIVLGMGALALTGQSLALRADHTVTLAVGTVTYTGQSAAFQVNRPVAISHGAFALSGQALALKADHTVTLGHGAVVLTGQAVALKHAAALVLASAGYTLSGQAISLKAARQILAEYASYALTGIDAEARSSRLVILSAFLRMRPALAGEIETQAALDGSITTEPAMLADADIRPAMGGVVHLRPALAAKLGN